MSSFWIEVALRGAGLLTVVLMLYGLLRRASPALRHGLLAASAFGLLVLPLLSTVLPALDAPILAARETPDLLHGGAAPALEPRPPARARLVPMAPAKAGPDTGAPEPRAARLNPGPRTRDLPTSAAAPTAAGNAGRATSWLLLLWIVGSIGVLLPWLLGHARVARWAREATAFPHAYEGCAGTPDVGMHPEVTAPISVGLFKRRILLPCAARSWPRERLQAVLRHEHAHTQRRDVLTAAFARFATALHWFNPLAWLAAALMRRESELACDTAAVRSGVEPHALAQTLVDLARGTPPPRWHDAAATLGRSSLERRVDAILAGPCRSRPLPRALSVLALACALALVAVLHPIPRGALAGEEKAAAELTVGPRGCDFTTIQAAVDAAPAKARLKIAAGTYAGRVVIDKPLSLVGAGWTKTRLEATFVASTQRGIRPQPTLRIRTAGGVTLRGLRLTLRGEGREGVSMRGAVLDIEGGRVRIDACAIVHSPASGIDISGRADVEIRRSLVSSARSTGIAIGIHGAGMPRVRVLESDIRYGHHRGITIGAGCNDVLIEDCRISGSAWHGIRYDDASPTIRRCRFSHNVRSAIYASGQTQARVEGNCFSDTGMGAVSCWFRCCDVYTGNTFAHNARNGIGILGASSPTIERNLFLDNPTGVHWSSIGGNGADRESAGAGTVRGNMFWNNGTDASNPLPAAAGNTRTDPRVGEGYVLAKDSPARKAGIGAGALPPSRSPFPSQPEEAEAARLFKRHLARYGEWARASGTSSSPGTAKTAAKTAREPVVTPHARAEPWILDIASAKGGAPRAAALAAMRTALASEDSAENHAGLLTLLATLKQRYDRDGLRAQVLPLLDRLEGRARVSAWYALYNLGPKDGDLRRLLAVVPNSDEALKRSASHLLHMYTRGRLEGEAEAVVLGLLADADKRRRREVLRGIWGARVGRELEARLIDLAATSDRAAQHDVVYFALSTLPEKSKAVVAALHAAVEANPSLMERAAWGLSHGVAREARDAVADFYAERIGRVTGASWLAKAFDALRDYGSKRHLAVLDQIADDEGRAEGTRARAESAARRIRQR